MQVLGTVGCTNLQVPAVLEDVGFIFFYSNYRQIFGSCTLPNMLLERIRFGAYRYRLAFHRATNNTFHQMHNGVSISTNHLCQQMLLCPMIRYLRLTSYDLLFFFAPVALSSSVMSIISTPSNTSSTTTSGISGGPPRQINYTAMLACFGVMQSSSLVHEVDASKLEIERGCFLVEGICKGSGSKELRLDTK
jgi:hypothetical protein